MSELDKPAGGRTARRLRRYRYIIAALLAVGFGLLLRLAGAGSLTLAIHLGGMSEAAVGTVGLVAGVAGLLLLVGGAFGFPFAVVGVFGSLFAMIAAPPGRRADTGRADSEGELT